MSRDLKPGDGVTWKSPWGDYWCVGYVAPAGRQRGNRPGHIAVTQPRRESVDILPIAEVFHVEAASDSVQ